MCRSGLAAVLLPWLQRASGHPLHAPRLSDDARRHPKDSPTWPTRWTRAVHSRARRPPCWVRSSGARHEVATCGRTFLNSIRPCRSTSTWCCATRASRLNRSRCHRYRTSRPSGSTTPRSRSPGACWSDRRAGVVGGVRHRRESVASPSDLLVRAPTASQHAASVGSFECEPVGSAADRAGTEAETSRRRA